MGISSFSWGGEGGTREEKKKLLEWMFCGGSRMKAGAQKLSFPAGFRFHPTDDELVESYLCRKCAGLQVEAPIIAEIDIYRFDPWELPDLALYGEREWYFFSPRDRKYPNGSRPNRAAGTGYWKATGADKPIGKQKIMGIKKALVFYAGKAPKGVKTNWIMHEYRLANVDRSAGKRTTLRLDEWVLCRIYNKKGGASATFHSAPQKADHFPEDEEQKPKIDSSEYSSVVNPAPLFRPREALVPHSNFPFNSSELLLKFPTHSSSSEHVQSTEFKEVQSDPKWTDFETSLDMQSSYVAGFPEDIFGSQMPYDQLPLFQDMFAYMQKKPF